MTSFTKFHRIVLTGLGVCGGAVTLYYNFCKEGNYQAYASWTTNFQPTVEWNYNWDRRSPSSVVRPMKGTEENKYNEAIDKSRPKAVRHLLLIRHGQYETAGKTDEDRKLTELGRKQAVLTGLRLREFDFPYTRVVRSTMKRANETAEIIQRSLPELPILDCSMLEEGAPIPPEPPIGNWRPEASFYQDGARIEAAFRKYFYRADAQQEKDSYEIIVCHANVIRYFVCRALQFPPEAWLRISLNHGSITWISLLPTGRVILRALGDTGHMPVEAITSN